MQLTARRQAVSGCVRASKKSPANAGLCALSRARYQPTYFERLFVGIFALIAFMLLVYVAHVVESR